MKIRTQFIISTFTFCLILLVLAVTVVITNQRMNVLNRQEEITLNLQQETNELGYLSNDYLIYQENQQLTRWEAKFSSIVSDLSQLKPGTPEQQLLVNNLQSNQQQAKNVFMDVKAALEKTALSQPLALDPTFIRTSWSRIEVQNQGLIFNANRLYQTLIDQEDQLKQNISWLTYILVAIFGAFVIATYFLNYRRTIQSIEVLQSGTRVIGSGNLDHIIHIRGKDEISDLSRAFNQMTASLKTVTASKSDLEREIALRKDVEEELRTTNDKLQEQAQDLEIEVDERKQVEESLQKYTRDLETANKELETFSYSVSHDLRSPLRTLDGFSEVLVMEFGDKLGETGKDYLDRIRKASHKMSQLIDDILKLSRISRAEIHQEQVDLSDLAKSITGELKIGQPQRQVEFLIAPEMIVTGDKSLLEIGLRNLLENAWKFTGKCETPRIECGVSCQNGEQIYFIKDNGSGFDMKYKDKLFQPFQRLHDDREFPGTGIGLATVQRVIRRHNGRIWAESEVGKGTVFYFTLG
jgi:signal transduction histidine kinase